MYSVGENYYTTVPFGAYYWCVNCILDGLVNLKWYSLLFFRLLLARGKSDAEISDVDQFLQTSAQMPILAYMDHDGANLAKLNMIWNSFFLQ